MMLIVLSDNPIYAANKVPDKLKFKQTLELAQLICSCDYSNVYKKIPQGKSIQEWILKNPSWVKTYALVLYFWCLNNLKLKEKTISDLFSIFSSINAPCNFDVKIKTAIFRYSKKYKSIFPSDAEIMVGNAITEYEKYLEWKNA